jgi:hypothetical protein
MEPAQARANAAKEVNARFMCIQILPKRRCAHKAEVYGKE